MDECSKCHSPTSLDEGCEDNTGLCHHCAQDEVISLREKLIIERNKRKTAERRAWASRVKRQSAEADLVSLFKAASKHLKSTNQHPHSKEWIALSERIARLM